jgi:hypothetical protein
MALGASLLTDGSVRSVPEANHEIEAVQTLCGLCDFRGQGPTQAILSQARHQQNARQKCITVAFRRVLHAHHSLPRRPDLAQSDCRTRRERPFGIRISPIVLNRCCLLGCVKSFCNNICQQRAFDWLSRVSARAPSLTSLDLLSLTTSQFADRAASGRLTF